jgi:hypothetical protein
MILSICDVLPFMMSEQPEMSLWFCRTFIRLYIHASHIFQFCFLRQAFGRKKNIYWSRIGMLLFTWISFLKASCRSLDTLIIIIIITLRSCLQLPFGSYIKYFLLTLFKRLTNAQGFMYLITKKKIRQKEVMKLNFKGIQVQWLLPNAVVLQVDMVSSLYNI